MKTLDIKIKHVYLLSGEETFYIDKAREKIFEKLQVEKSDVTTLDYNNKIPLQEIISTIDSAPFFNPKNVVLVKNAPFFSGEIKSERLEKTLSNIKEVKARDAIVIGIAAAGDTELEKYLDHVIFVPETDELLIPLLTVVPLQLLAYYAAITRGCDVDKPRNLAKSVTVE